MTSKDDDTLPRFLDVEAALKALLGDDYRTPEQRAASRKATQERHLREWTRGERKLTRREERELHWAVEEILEEGRKLSEKLRAERAARGEPEPLPLVERLKTTFEPDDDDVIEWHEEMKREFRRRNRGYLK